MFSIRFLFTSFAFLYLASTYYFLMPAATGRSDESVFVSPAASPVSTTADELSEILRTSPDRDARTRELESTDFFGFVLETESALSARPESASARLERAIEESPTVDSSHLSLALSRYLDGSDTVSFDAITMMIERGAELVTDDEPSKTPLGLIIQSGNLYTGRNQRSFSPQAYKLIEYLFAPLRSSRPLFRTVAPKDVQEKIYEALARPDFVPLLAQLCLRVKEPIDMIDILDRVKLDRERSYFNGKSFLAYLVDSEDFDRVSLFLRYYPSMIFDPLSKSARGEEYDLLFLVYLALQFGDYSFIPSERGIAINPRHRGLRRESPSRIEPEKGPNKFVERLLLFVFGPLKLEVAAAKQKMAFKRGDKIIKVTPDSFALEVAKTGFSLFLDAERRLFIPYTSDTCRYVQFLVLHYFPPLPKPVVVARPISWGDVLNDSDDEASEESPVDRHAARRERMALLNEAEEKADSHRRSRFAETLRAPHVSDSEDDLAGGAARSDSSERVPVIHERSEATSFARPLPQQKKLPFIDTSFDEE